MGTLDRASSLSHSLADFTRSNRGPESTWPDAALATHFGRPKILEYLAHPEATLPTSLLFPTSSKAPIGQRTTQARQLPSWKYKQRSFGYAQDKSLGADGVTGNAASMTSLPKRPAHPASVMTKAAQLSDDRHALV